MLAGSAAGSALPLLCFLIYWHRSAPSLLATHEATAITYHATLMRKSHLLHDRPLRWLHLARLGKTQDHLTVINIAIALQTHSVTESRFPFKCNRLRCVCWVRCVNENRKKRQQPITVATASTEHSYWLALAFVTWKFQQWQHEAVKQWQPWLAACQRKRLRFLWFFVYATHATQAIAFEWKPGFTMHSIDVVTISNLPHLPLKITNRSFR